MPKYDAFGREIGENTLSGLGGGSDATVQPAPDESERPDPSPVAAPAAEPSGGWTEAPAPAQPPRRRSRKRSGRPLGCLLGLVILAAVVAGPVIAVVSFVGSASDTIDDVTGALDDIPTVEPPDAADEPGAAEPKPPPTGITGRSMIARTNFAPVLRRLGRSGVPAVVSIRLSADRAAVETVRGSRTRRIDFRYDGAVDRGTQGRAFDALGRVPIGAMDAGAPVRLVRAAAKRFGVRDRGIDYLIVRAQPTGGGHRWIAYFKNGTYVEGDERGRVVRRIS